jgi:hypothetical protein
MNFKKGLPSLGANIDPGFTVRIWTWQTGVSVPATRGGLAAVSHPERTNDMALQIIDTAFWLALIYFYLFLDQCDRILTRMKRSRIFPKKSWRGHCK